MADAKYVNIIAPGGVTLNYMGITGIIRNTPMELSLIKKSIERGCIVEEVKEDGTTVELTLENYEGDNGGKEVTEDVIYVKDEEADDQEAFEQQREDYLTGIGELYKEYFENKKEEESEDEEDPSTVGDSSEGEGGLGSAPPTLGSAAPSMASVKETVTPISQHIETTTNTFKRSKKNKFKSYKEEQSE